MINMIVSTINLELIIQESLNVPLACIDNIKNATTGTSYISCGYIIIDHYAFLIAIELVLTFIVHLLVFKVYDIHIFFRFILIFIIFFFFGLNHYLASQIFLLFLFVYDILHHLLFLVFIFMLYLSYEMLIWLHQLLLE